MAGHSHWRSIKYKKEREDIQRSRTFSKLSRLISIAAREGGQNLEANPKLRMAIEQAKKLNMPSDNIERAIKRGLGQLEGAHLEPVIFEALGPGGISIIIEGITDNKNRALSEIRQILNQNGGKLVGEGGIRWMFKSQEKDGRLEWVPTYEIKVSEQDKAACEKLFEALDENEAVQEIYSNLQT